MEQPNPAPTEAEEVEESPVAETSIEDTEVEVTSTEPAAPADSPEAVPVTDDLMAQVREAVDFDAIVEKTNFFFKKVTDTETKVETKRPTLELAIPFPSIEGITNILLGKDEMGGEKGLELLVDAVHSIVIARARGLINEDMGITAANMPFDKLSWKAIANMPKAQRTGGGIPKETWDEFGADYIAVMQEHAGKTVDQAGRAAKILVGKFSTIKTNKKVIAKLIEQLALYAGSSESIEEFTGCVEFLIAKADDLLNVDEDELLLALG